MVSRMRERQRDRERDRETERQTETQRETEREREINECSGDTRRNGESGEDYDHAERKGKRR